MSRPGRAGEPAASSESELAPLLWMSLLKRDTLRKDAPVDCRRGEEERRGEAEKVPNEVGMWPLGDVDGGEL